MSKHSLMQSSPQTGAREHYAQERATMLAHLLEIHTTLLGKRLKALVLCGSVLTDAFVVRHSDIDYLVIVSDASLETLEACRRARLAAARHTSAKLSNTVVSLAELERFTHEPARIDQKATQALLEAYDFEPAWLYRDPDVRLTLPSAAALRSFAASNLAAICAMARKTYIRSPERIDTGLLCKLAVITLKLRAQLKAPYACVHPACDQRPWQSYLSQTDHGLYELATNKKLLLPPHDAPLIEELLAYFERCGNLRI